MIRLLLVVSQMGLRGESAGDLGVLLVLRGRGGGRQQSADGQGDLLLLLVHSGDLGVHDLALAEDIAGLLNPAVSDLGEIGRASCRERGCLYV